MIKFAQRAQGVHPAAIPLTRGKLLDTLITRRVPPSYGRPERSSQTFKPLS